MGAGCAGSGEGAVVVAGCTGTGEGAEVVAGGPLPGVHWLYHSFCSKQKLPGSQQNGPPQLLPPHCPQTVAQSADGVGATVGAIVGAIVDGVGGIGVGIGAS